MNFESLLQQYKDEPRRESVALLLTDDRLLNYAVIFKQCPPERRMVDGVAVEPTEDSWSALWDCVTVNCKAHALLGDDELVKAQKMVERLKGLRLVYPDGTLQEAATLVITKRIKHWLE